VIPPKSNRKHNIDCDFHAYRWRHLMENFFCSLKIFAGLPPDTIKPMRATEP
jgi:hypothetical protein